MSTPIKINFSAEELSSEARTFEVPPSGDYDVYITKCEVTPIKQTKPDGSPNKNFGKHYWAIELTIASGKFEKSKLWTNCMLFTGAGFSTVQLLRAAGFSSAVDTGEMPPAEALIGKRITAVVKKQKDDYKSSPGDLVYKAEVKGFKSQGAVGGISAAKAAPGGSPLP